MVILKKIKASSLNEVIIATIIIMIIFSISIGTLNNIMQNTTNKNSHSIQNKLNELIYQYQHKNLQLPYNIANDKWTVSIIKKQRNDINKIEFEVISNKTNKKLTRKIIFNEKK